MGCSPGNVHGLEFVESSEHTGSCDTSEDVSTSTLHHGHEAFILHDLHGTVNGALVLSTTTRGHHHKSSDGVNGVGHEASSDSHKPTEEERETNASTISNEEGFEGVKHTKVHATVDEDTIRLEGLDIDINETIELALATFALGIVSQPGSGVVKRVDKEKRQGTGESTAGNVGCELSALTGTLRGSKDCLDGILEGKVKSLGREVSKHISQVSSPEEVDTLSPQDSLGAVNDALVWLVKSALLDHLILILDEELDSLNWGGSGLRDTSSNTSEHKVLNESKFLFVAHYGFLSWSSCRSESSNISLV